MSIRYDMEKMQCSIKSKKDKVSVQFEDKFGLKYFEKIIPKDILRGGPFDKYKIRKKDNKLEFKIKDETLSLELIKQIHLQLIDQLKPHIDLNYCYFKSLPDESHISRNKRFMSICQKPYFKEIFPEIRSLIFLQTDQKTSQFLEDSTLSQQNHFKKDQLIIYIISSKRQSIKHITKYMETYTEQTVVFGLDQYFAHTKIKQNGLVLGEVQTIINRLIQYLKNDIVELGRQCELIIQSITSYVPFTKKERHKDNTDSLGIVLKVEGMFQSLPQFYFNLISLFSKHPITLGQVNEIFMDGNYHSTELKFKQINNMVMFFGSDTAIAVLNLHEHFKDWIEFKREMRKGQFLISELNGFTRDQIQILIKDHHQLQEFINNQTYNDFVIFTFIKVDAKSFMIHCQKNMLEKFISRAFDYLKKNTYVQVRREEFVNEFEIHLFMKLAKSGIQVRYPKVSFVVKDGALFSRCKDAGLRDLEIEMKNERRKMLKKIARLPTIKPLKTSSKYHILQDEFLAQSYCHQQSLRTIHYKFNDRINIFLKPVQSISRCRPLLIPIIDRYFSQFRFFMDHFQLNNLSTQRYQKYSNDKVNERVITYSMSKSRYVNQMLVWYIESDQRNNLNLKKIKWDIDDTVVKYKHQKNIQFVVPYHLWKSEYYFGNFFIELFKTFKRLQDLVQTQNITIFYQTQNTNKKIHDITRRAFEMTNKDVFVLKSKMYLSVQEIQKIMLVQLYSARYWAENENKMLSPLNSFVFNYEKSKKPPEFKVPLFLMPIEMVEYEYLLCLNEDVYYKVDKLCRITKFMLETNKVLQRFSKVVKKYFSFSEYIVVYMNQQETQIEGKNLYYWQKAANPQQISQKVKRIEISEEDKLIQKKQIDIDIHVKKNDIVPKFIVETHEDFIPQVKRIIFQDQ